MFIIDVVINICTNGNMFIRACAYDVCDYDVCDYDVCDYDVCVCMMTCSFYVFI